MASELGERVLDFLRARQDRMVELLHRLVEAESPSRDPRSQERVLSLLAEAFDARGYRTLRQRGEATGGAMLATPRSRERGAPYQILLGHCDTVWPVGTLATQPAGVEDGRFVGPGSYDMKAGLVQGLFALEAVAELAPPAVTPVFFVNSDEEIGSRESSRTIRMLAKGADRAFVLEPSLGPDGKLKTARKGIGRFTVTVKGRAAHAGLEPERGASAILELSHVIQALFALNDPERGVTVNVGTIDGGLSPNVVAPEGRAIADVRVLTHGEAERIAAAIHAIEAQTPGTELRIQGGFGRPPMEHTPVGRRLWELAQRAAGEVGIDVEEATVGGGSDGNTTSQYTATLDGLGAVGGGAHAADEHLLVEKMAERGALLAVLLSYPPLGEIT